MIKAIVFDCFGVLASDGFWPFLEQHFGQDRKLYEAAVELSKQVDAGIVSYDAMLVEFAHMAGLGEPLTRQALENNVPDGALFALIADELKPHYKIGMLSNAGDNWLDEIFTPNQVALFDAVALSYEIGFIKPQPEAYQAVAERLGVELDECVLVDDIARYCDGARAAGMQAVRYKGLDGLRRELARLGIGRAAGEMQP